MQALIDGDLVAFRCAASCEKQGVVVEDFGIACARADNLIMNIEDSVEASGNQIFLSGGQNFRKTIYPRYKANRDNQERPVYLEPLREWLVTEWGAKVTDGIEADDAMGIAQTDETIICSLDKDMLQVPGHHFQWEIQGTSSTGKKWLKEANHVFVSPEQGLRNFYWQMVMGDVADNVPGFDGKMRQKVPKFMDGHYELMQTLETEQELFEYVYALYTNSNTPTQQMLLNGACLWIQRYEGDLWLQKGKQLLRETLGTEGHGLKEDFAPSSLQPSVPEVDGGNPNMTP